MRAIENTENTSADFNRSARINHKKGSMHVAQVINLNMEVNFLIDINDYDSSNTDFSPGNIFAVL